ncbi:MAG: hypothetical protein HQ517_08770, partial [SAR324 cluster bacterium]|nr:hypothetical protein [SAR324 cluster bacterium]
SYFKERRLEDIEKLKSLGLKETYMQSDDANRINTLYNGVLWAIVGKMGGQAGKDFHEFAKSKGMTK